MGASIDPRIKEAADLLDAAARIESTPIYDLAVPAAGWRADQALKLRQRAAQLQREARAA